MLKDWHSNGTEVVYRSILKSITLDFRILPQLLAYELNVLFSISRSLREDNMQISERVF